jgi:hypothetical protein
MLVRPVIGCALLAGALAYSATPARACEGLACLFGSKAETPSAPLKLNEFTRQKAKTTRPKPNQRASKVPPEAAPRKRTKTAPPGRALDDPTLAVARALALPVRVVASDEVNEIDLAADTPVAGQIPLGFAAESAAETMGAGGVRSIDRSAEAVSPAPPVAPAASRASEPASSPAIDNWAMRVWAMMQGAVSAVTSSAGRLIP